MLIVDARVHVWSEGHAIRSTRQISSYRAENCPKEMELVMGRAVCDWIGWKLPN